MASSLNNPHLDPYDVLGIPSDASSSQIKAAYRKLAMKLHPDRRPSQQQQPREDKEFAEIAEAYAILSDPISKRDYDHLRRYGAFDSTTAESSHPHHRRNACSNRASGNRSQRQPRSKRYTEDYSGGYYKQGYVPPPSTPHHPSFFAKFSSMKPPAKSSSTRAANVSTDERGTNGDGFGGLKSLQSKDSFFEDLLYYNLSKSPSSTDSVNQKRRNNHNDGEMDDDRNDVTFPSSTSSSSSSSTTTTSRQKPLDPKSESRTQQSKESPPPTTTKQQQPPQRQRPPIKNRPGIGFSLRPLGKHLSIHIPSRSEIIMSMMKMQQQQQQQQPQPQDEQGQFSKWNHNLFGARVTFTTAHSSNNTTTARDGNNDVERKSAAGGGKWWSGKLDQAILSSACGANDLNSASDYNVPPNGDSDDCCGPIQHDMSPKSATATKTMKKVPTNILSSTTTRIAGGKRRCVTRTVHVHSDGTREVVVEEDGVVKVRKVYYSAGSATATNGHNEVKDKCKVNIKKKAQLKESQYEEKADKEVEEEDDVKYGANGGYGGVGRIQKDRFFGLFKSCLAPACTCLPSSSTPAFVVASD